MLKFHLFIYGILSFLDRSLAAIKTILKGEEGTMNWELMIKILGVAQVGNYLCEVPYFFVCVVFCTRNVSFQNDSFLICLLLYLVSHPILYLFILYSISITQCVHKE